MTRSHTGIKAGDLIRCRIAAHDATAPWPLPDGCVQTVVTSPPYWGLRDYGVDGQIGLERTQEEYVARLIAVMREARRVLRDDGTLWLNLGDCYWSDAGSGHQGNSASSQRAHRRHTQKQLKHGKQDNLKPKDLAGIPWRVAFALQADGWWLRSDIIWHKPNPMPESVRDRPTKAHEYLFLLAKSERYYYDAEAIAEPIVYGDHPRNGTTGPPIQAPGQPVQVGMTRRRRSGNKERVLWPGRCRPDSQWEYKDGKRNKRSVWTITTSPFPEAHFATFPPALVEPCIKAGSREGDLIVDPFCGSGTTGMVALRLNRRFVGFDISEKYIDMARRRIEGDAPLLNQGVSA